MSAQKKSGWGSLLGNAVAGLESRLDNILSEEQAGAKAKEAAAAAGDAAVQDPAKTAADKQRLQVDQGGSFAHSWMEKDNWRHWF